MFENIADDLSIMMVEKGIIKPENRDFFTSCILQSASYSFFGYSYDFTHYKNISRKYGFCVYVLVYKTIFRRSPLPIRGELFFVSILLYLVMLLFYDIDMHAGRVFLCVAAFVSVLLVLIFSPIEHKNKPLSVVERRKYGIISKIIAVILAIIMCVPIIKY